MHKSFRVTFEEKKVARLIVEVAGICENILKKKKKEGKKTNEPWLHHFTGNNLY